MGDPILREKCKKVGRLSKSVQTLIDDMVDTMHDAPGIGLAAPQVGVPLRVIVAQIPEDDEDDLAARQAIRRITILKSSKPRASTSRKKDAFRYPAT